MSSAKIFLLLSICVGTALLGLTQTNEAWEHAKQIDRINEYESFIQQFPTSEHVKEAKKQIEKLRWINAKLFNSLDFYERFVTEFPESEHVGEATELVAREFKRWNFRLVTVAGAKCNTPYFRER